MQKELLTIPGAASRLTVSEKTAWRMRYAGKFEVVYIGRSVRVTAESVDKVIEDGTTPPKDQNDDDEDDQEYV